MTKPRKTRAIITEEEWDQLEHAFTSTPYIDVIKRLRAGGNNCQRACDLFEEMRSESGPDRMNDISHRLGSPFVMARMKVWTPQERRPERLLALARVENRTAP